MELSVCFIKLADSFCMSPALEAFMLLHCEGLLYTTVTIDMVVQVTIHSAIQLHSR